ncbi:MULTISPECIES: acyl-CoA dehydrogenase family protein [unclassified Hyphomonas]|uniref:acyl-CoA dehydrogenase family protein n=1 Tax=unclassified Hyphomonas TaxID=2630699 RepID=UPI000458ACBC|nr:MULTISPECIES: acyl-CoA dehydrogenase family protein [unclassified Hyphomonas]KCZ46082.1 acyl-CoA dehydrogenase [Hyphomonas sp. CY54-11-8]RAN40009.1 acyl-CoA dehydrogenase [Hyphomonas sp. GM-8P]
MNLDFSDEQKQLRDQVRRFLSEKCPPEAVRAILEGDERYDKSLYAGLAEMGLLGAAIPEEYGGVGLGHLELCVVAEELGRVLAPVPVSSSIYLAAEFLLLAGSENQKSEWLPKLASGEAVGTFALVEGQGRVRPDKIAASVKGGKLSGAKMPVADGFDADFAIVAARDEAGGISLYLASLAGDGVTREVLETIDPTRGQARITFENVSVEPLGATGDGWYIATQVIDRAAVLMAFEQLGGADRALEMARDYALERMAFGRPIGSFQAIKHMLADMYVSATLARSNCYYGAWALGSSPAELPVAAATARVSATTAFQHCSKNNIQVHGGMGFTWAFDCHLFYRRSNGLALALGSLSTWESELIERMSAGNAETAA